MVKCGDGPCRLRPFEGYNFLPLLVELFEQQNSLQLKKIARMPKMTATKWRSFLAANWDLGFTAFGGPPVHFKIVRMAISFPGLC
jgi:hypothetical protein